MDIQSPASQPTLNSPNGRPRSTSMDRDACMRLEQALYREWIEPDGLGGYSSSTVHLCPTRRYHGLLVAPLPGGGERHVFLSRLEEELVGQGKSFPISTGRYPGAYSPEGFQSIESFSLSPFPTWEYHIGEVIVRREILSVWGQHTVLVRWSRSGGPADIRLRLRPLLAFRRNHDLTRENVDLNSRVKRLENGFVAKPYPALPSMATTVSAEGFAYIADPVWYRDVEYLAEIRRGFPAHEDHFSPGRVEVSLPEGESVVLAATIGDAVEDPSALWKQEVDFRNTQNQSVRTFSDNLTLSSDAYLYRDAHGRPGILAGYPWFGEWGRDTFISLPGLTLPAKRYDVCLSVLEGALPFLREGLLPNIYGADVASSSYRSADAALWYARAVLMYQRASGQDEAVCQRFGLALRSIAEAYLSGGESESELGMRVDDAGLLHAGSESLNATWMDAMVNGIPVTPREGSPVELQALWYQLAEHLAEMAALTGDAADEARWREQSKKAGRVLAEQFWMAEKGYLADRLSSEGKQDPSIRPNAVFAASLEFSPLSEAQRASVVQVALNELLTPRGLRTLSPHDPRYVGRYEGGPEDRDGAYHQGTVWPWLLGFLVEAALRVNPREGARVRRLEKVVLEFEAHLSEHGLAQISEVFDGDPPHRPGGTPAQAWSVAEVLRSLHLLQVGGF